MTTSQSAGVALDRERRAFEPVADDILVVEASRHWTSSHGMVATLVALGTVLATSITLGSLASQFLLILLGALWITLFFALFSGLHAVLMRRPTARVPLLLGGSAFLLRIGAVVLCYFGFRNATGLPFEWYASDSLWYHEQGARLGALFRDGDLSAAATLLNAGPSDLGYVAVIGVIYALVGPEVLAVRLLHAIAGAWTVVVLYRSARYAIGEMPARTAALLVGLNPYLIYYSGLHLKETFMILLVINVFYYTIRAGQRIGNVRANVSLLVANVLGLFFFRTFLAVLMIFAVFTHILLHDRRPALKRVSMVAGVTAVIALLITVVQPQLWNEVVEKIEMSSGQWERELAQKEQGIGGSIGVAASRPVFIAAATVGPLPSVADVQGQENSLIQYGFAWIRQVFTFFALAGVIETIRRRNRELTVLVVMLAGYIAVLGAAGLPSSHRFQLPTLAAWSVLTAVALHRPVPRKMWFAWWVIALVGVAVVVMYWNYTKISLRAPYL